MPKCPFARPEGRFGAVNSGLANTTSTALGLTVPGSAGGSVCCGDGKKQVNRKRRILTNPGTFTIPHDELAVDARILTTCGLSSG